MKIYGKYAERLINEYGSLNKATSKKTKKIELSQGEKKDFSNSRGYMILENYKKKNVITFPALFRVYCEMMKEKWTWNGADDLKWNKVAAVLDNTKHEGECGILAGALIALWRWPEPLGMGKTGGLLSCYAGPTRKGFYSHHDLKGVFKLKPDVCKPLENLWKISKQGNWRKILQDHKKISLLPIKNWENHQTVKYGNSYYDPSYQKIYDREEEMMALKVSISKTSSFNYQVAQAINTIQVDTIKIEAQKDVYFAWVRVSEREVIGLGPYVKEEDVKVEWPKTEKVQNKENCKIM